MARIEGNWGDYMRKLGIQEDTILLPAGRYLQTERNLRRNRRVQLLVASRKAQFPWARGALVIHVEEVTAQL
jgi:hypothetical protein